MRPHVRGFLSCVLVLAANLLPVGEACAYVAQGGKWSQPDGKGSPVTITYSYNNLLDGVLLQPDGQPLSPNIVRQSVEEALGLWAGVAPLHFVEVEDQGGPTYFGVQYSDGQFGQIRFNAMYINGADPTIGKPSTKAMAYFPGTGGNLGGDVFFDYSDRWQVAGTLRQPDVLGVAVHELGHTLGLGHSTVQQTDAYWEWEEYDDYGEVETITEAKGAAVMYWITPRFEGLGTGALFPDDIAGIQAVYGVGVGSVTPLAKWYAPEPASSVLAALAALSAVVLRRRRHVTHRATMEHLP